MSEAFFFGDLVRQFRMRKGLSQKHLAELIGVSRETISLWERGYYKPETDTILYELARVLALSEPEHEQFFQSYTVTALKSSFRNPPARRNPYFTGREDRLRTLHQLLSTGKQVALTQAISGLGGIGKTQMALEYAYRYQRSYHDIFWAVADSSETLIGSFTQLATLLQLRKREEQDQTKVVEAVKHWFCEHKGWLLILDNVEDLKLVANFVPANRQGAVLLTTRAQVTEPIALTIELETMPEEEGALFLLRRTKLLALDASLDGASQTDRTKARAISKTLEGLPLALDQAGAYILETGCGLADYLNLYRERHADLLKRRGNVPSDHPASVSTTFSLAFEKVEQANSAAVDLLRFCAFLAPDAIAEEIITQGAPHLGSVLQPVAADEYALNESIEILRTFSLIKRDPVEKILNIHRLVQVVLQEEMQETEQRQWAEVVVRSVNQVFPDDFLACLPIVERYSAHVLRCAAHIERWHFVFPEAAHLLDQMGRYAQERGQYPLGERLCLQALALRETFLSQDHPDILLNLLSVGLSYYYQGKYAEAEKVVRKASAQERNNPACRADLFNLLGVVYRAQSNYKEATELYQQALALYEQISGPHHPSVAKSLNNLAHCYLDQGIYAEAEPLFLKAVDIYDLLSGSPNSHWISPLHNLSVLYELQGKYVLAEQFGRRALQLREEILGGDHPDVALSLGELGRVLRLQAKNMLAESEEFYRRAVAIQEKAYGGNHPDLALTLNNWAILCYQRGKYAEAESLHLQALSMREQTLGTDHPDVAQSLINLSLVYHAQKKYREAELFCRRGLTINEGKLGKDHVNVSYGLNALAKIYTAQEKYTEAEPLFRRALAIQEKTSENSPGLVTIMESYSELLRRMQREEEVTQLKERMRTINEKQMQKDS